MYITYTDKYLYVHISSYYSHYSVMNLIIVFSQHNLEKKKINFFFIFINAYNDDNKRK